MAAVESGKAVYALLYGVTLAPLNYIADDSSYVEFHTVSAEITEEQFVDA
jgi:hypothetical protein